MKPWEVRRQWITRSEAEAYLATGMGYDCWRAYWDEEAGEILYQPYRLEDIAPKDDTDG